MAQRLRSVNNATSSDAVLTNTEHDYDRTDIPALHIVRTGGKDGDFIRIPDCSGSEYYDDHHILIKSENWTVALWNNDDQDHKLYWCPGDFYSESRPVDGSGNDEYVDCSIRIDERQGKSGVWVYAWSTWVKGEPAD